MPSAFTFAYNLNVYFPTADQFILFSLGDYEHIFEVCFGFSSRNIVNKNYLLGKNVLMHIVHFISSTKYILMYFNVYFSKYYLQCYLNMKIQFNVHYYCSIQYNHHIIIHIRQLQQMT